MLKELYLFPPYLIEDIQIFSLPPTLLLHFHDNQLHQAKLPYLMLTQQDISNEDYSVRFVLLISYQQLQIGKIVQNVQGNLFLFAMRLLNIFLIHCP